MNTTTNIQTKLTIYLTAIGVLLAAWLATASTAEASTYSVRQCWEAGGVGSPDLTKIRADEFGTAYQFIDQCASSSESDQNIIADGINAHLSFAQLQFTAPPGTVIDGAVWDYGISNKSNYRAIGLRGIPGGGQETVISAAANEQKFGTYSTNEDSRFIAMGMFCANSGGCADDPINPFAEMGDIRMTMKDTTPPDEPSIGGALFNGNWHNGSTAYSLTVGDTGAGVDLATVSYNGATHISLRDFCTPANSMGWFTRMAPCPASGTHNASFNTASSVFHEGPDNLIEFCIREFGNAPAIECASKNAKIDNTAPAAPTNLTVAQGSGWQRVNDFDLTWSNPTQAHAPIAAYNVKVSGPGGTTNTRYTNSLQARNNVAVPADVPGEYTVEVYLEDAAGNVNPNASATKTIRFDDVAPEESTPLIANGWLGQAELDAGYSQEWERPEDPHPVSGIQGYAFVVDQSPSTDPCDVGGAGGPDTECDGGEVNYQGLGNREATLTEADLEEGNNWAHVAPVSGSGVKTEEIRHTKLQVDTIAPSSELSGAGFDWHKTNRTVTITATDERSGMVDTDDYPDDDPPATFIDIDGTESSEPDASISAEVTGDGVHTVKFWARDLAGNTAENQSQQVKIDTTDPTGFLQDPNKVDPEEIAGKVGDATSGVAEAQLAYREGNGQWVDVPTTVSGDRATARIDSGQMKEGKTYTFRLTVTDEAGNELQTTKLKDGTERTQTGPLRDGTQIKNLAVNGRGKAKVKYGKKANVTGQLVDENGNGVGGAEVVVVQSFDSGSSTPEIRTPATTNGQGQFSTKIAKGPSRRITVQYAGDAQRLSTASGDSARLNVRGKVKFKATKRQVKPGQKVRFKGKIARKGAKIPGGGKTIEVQVKVGGEWIALKSSSRTRKKGKFAAAYRFGSNPTYSLPQTFKFRVLSLPEAGWPYLKAKSKKVKVTVTK